MTKKLSDIIGFNDVVGKIYFIRLFIFLIIHKRKLHHRTFSNFRTIYKLKSLKQFN